MVSDSGIVTQVPKEFVRKWWGEIVNGLPDEKAKVHEDQARLAAKMREQGSTRMDGLGQMAARINSRLFFRLQAQHGNNVHEWMPEYLKDNPHLCATGYRPKVNPARHGLTGGWMGKQKDT
jgi:hypothetical protein